MPEKVRIVIVSNAEARVQSLRAALQPVAQLEVLGSMDCSEALHKLEILSPHIALLDAGTGLEEGIRFVERCCRKYPQLSLVVLSDNGDANVVRRYMRAGAKDYLYEANESEALGSMLLSVHAREQEKAHRHTMAVLSDQSTPDSRIVAFISAKGGVGKTTLAMNTAVALAIQGKRTAVVDLDLQFGDASLLLNCSPVKTIIQLVQESSEIDPDVVERYMLTHASGVRLLATGSKPEEAEYVTSADVRVLLQSLRKNYDYIIVDTAPLANDIFFAVLDTVDERFMVSTLSLAVVKNNRLLLDLLVELDYDIHRIKHILNRANAKNGLKIGDISRILATDLYAEIDNDFQFVETAANEGALFIQKDPQHRLSRQIYALTAKLDQEYGRTISRRNPLKNLLMKFSS